jgi:5S rRNA maturation endonuclease (ribonuclease M5)
MTYESFIVRFHETKPSSTGVMVQCPAHEDKTASLAVGKGRNGGVVVKCFAGCTTEEVVKSLGLTMKDLFPKSPDKPFHLNGNVRNSLFGKKTTTSPKVKPVIEKIYSYTDRLGREVYQAVRLKPKDFRQRHQVDGNWIWKMDGVERVLYRLPEVEKAAKVWIVEGEKDADNLVALGFCATCNVGGAGKWMDGYTACLAGKEIILCGDNDEPGQKHIELIHDSVATKVKCVKVLKVPSPHKDVSDLIAAEKDAKAVLEQLEQSAVPHVGGIRMPVYSMADIEPRYHQFVTVPENSRVDLSKWLPSFRGRLRPLSPGTVVLVSGDTGTGKTNVLQNVAMAFKELRVLMFELELSEEDLFERFFALRAKADAKDIEEEYKKNGCFGHKAMMEQFPNLYICPESSLTLEQFEAIVVGSELKMGGKPDVVLLDYAQLVKGPGLRYEKTSNVAEGIKVVAKSTRTVIFVASQVDRASAKSGEVGLHSAKDSGSLENSCGVFLGLKRTPEDPTLLIVEVVKATKGGSGTIIHCNIDGAKSLVTERARVDTEEVSKGEPPPE